MFSKGNIKTPKNNDLFVSGECLEPTIFQNQEIDVLFNIIKVIVKKVRTTLYNEYKNALPIEVLRLNIDYKIYYENDMSDYDYNFKCYSNSDIEKYLKHLYIVEFRWQINKNKYICTYEIPINISNMSNVAYRNIKSHLFEFLMQNVIVSISKSIY